MLTYYGSEIRVSIVLNGSDKVVVSTDASPEALSQAGSNLAVLRLQKGDRVWVEHAFGRGYYTYSNVPATTFSGFLI
jgi:hypothetical protein